MNVSGVFHDSTTISYQYIERIKDLDYKHILFRCRKLHDNGHLFRDFPWNDKTTKDKGKDYIDKQGLKKIHSREESHQSYLNN